MVCRKARNKDFFTLENAPKDLCSYVTRRGSVGINDISIVICHVYKVCKIYHTYTNTTDKLDVNSPNLLNIFNFLKSFDVKRFFLGTNYCSFRYFTDEGGSYILTDFMNQIFARNGGPEFVFSTFYSNFINFHKNKQCIDSYCSFTATHKQSLNKYDFRITKDNRTGCVFSIDLEQLDCFDFIKK